MGKRFLALSEPNLRKMYIGWNWSTIKIADSVGCSDAAVCKALRRHNILIRTRSQAAKNKKITPEHRAKLVKIAGQMNKGKFGSKHPGWKNARHIDRYGL